MRPPLHNVILRSPTLCSTGQYYPKQSASGEQISNKLVRRCMVIIGHKIISVCWKTCNVKIFLWLICAGCLRTVFFVIVIVVTLYYEWQGFHYRLGCLTMVLLTPQHFNNRVTWFPSCWMRCQYPSTYKHHHVMDPRECMPQQSMGGALVSRMKE